MNYWKLFKRGKSSRKETIEGNTIALKLSNDLELKSPRVHKTLSKKKKTTEMIWPAKLESKLKDIPNKISEFSFSGMSRKIKAKEENLQKEQNEN